MQPGPFFVQPSFPNFSVWKKSKSCPDSFEASLHFFALFCYLPFVNVPLHPIPLGYSLCQVANKNIASECCPNSHIAVQNLPKIKWKILLVPKIPFQLSDLLRFAMDGKRLDFPLFLNYIRSALLKSYLTFSWSLCKYEKGKYQRIFGRSMHLLLPFPLFVSLNGFSNFIHFGSLSAWLLWQSSISQITHTDFTKTISKYKQTYVLKF